ncbi:MAG: PIN domain-containing protein [Cyanobacteria bacterium J06639_14]
MEWLNQLTQQVVGLDTAPLIYFVEENPTYLKVVEPFFTAFDQGQFRIVTSTVTLLEVLVQPLRIGDKRLASQYREILLGQDSLSVQLVSTEIAELAAQLRAEHNLRTPDAVQLATAIQSEAKLFFTNDAKLKGFSQLEILVLDELLAD